MTPQVRPIPSDPTQSELLTVTAARDLAEAGVVFAGIGLPTLAVSLAQETVAPHLEVVYESGVTGAHPDYLPATIADSVLITGAEAVLTLPAVFGYVLQGGRIDVGFLGAAQIDRHGSLNSSVIGEWRKPLKRLPGSGGAHDVMACAKEVHVIMRRHTPAAFVRELDFCTSPSPDRALAAGGCAYGHGVTKVYTELGVLSRTGVGEELTLTAVNRGVEPDDVIAATGWPLQVSNDLHVINTPSPEELRILREELDPRRIYLR
ncbi:CoA-transferase subunit beta [soil metagenome]